MKIRYYGIVGKYGVLRFQLWLALVLRRNTMNYSKRSPMMQWSKKRKLVAVVPFSTDQSVFCHLQEFFQARFQTLKLTCTHVIWTLMLIIMYIQVIVVCHLSFWSFFCWKYFIRQFKSSFSNMTCRALWNATSYVPLWCIN